LQNFGNTHFAKNKLWKYILRIRAYNFFSIFYFLDLSLDIPLKLNHPKNATAKNKKLSKVCHLTGE
jgi:hypothetical protein